MRSTSASLRPFVEDAIGRRRPSDVALEDARSRRGGTRPSLIARARASPTPSTSTRSATLGPHDLLQVARSGRRRGRRRSRAAAGSCAAAGSRAAAAAESRPTSAREVQHRGDLLEVEQLLVVEVGERAPCTSSSSQSASSTEVVLGHEAAVVLDAAHQLLELEQHEAAVGAELDDVALDLLGDAAHHLGPLEDGDDVAHGHEVLDLERRQRAADGVEAGLVALEDLQRLVGPGEHAGGSARACASRRRRWIATTDMVLRDRDHRHVDLAGDPLGGAVPGARLRRRDVGVGDEVHVGPGDAAGSRRRG